VGFERRILAMKIAIRIVLIVVCFAATAAFAQIQQSEAMAQKEQKFKDAKNRWMLVPVDVRGQRDSVSSAERQSRDAFWDGLIGASAPLSKPQTTFRHITRGSYLLTSPEFPNAQNGIWLMGKFESYHTFLSSSERSVYTEVNLRVQHIFGHPTMPPPAKGAVIDVGRPGGTISAPWNGVLSYLVDEPLAYDAQPGHTYLFLLEYHPEGNFYTQSKRWELTDGVVRPDSELEQYRAEHGKSEINGLKVPDLINYLDHKFAK
jgi:hypothetical protein